MKTEKKQFFDFLRRLKLHLRRVARCRLFVLKVIVQSGARRGDTKEVWVSFVLAIIIVVVIIIVAIIIVVIIIVAIIIVVIIVVAIIIVVVVIVAIVVIIKVNFQSL